MAFSQGAIVMLAPTFASVLDTSSGEAVLGLTCTSIPGVVWKATPFVGDGSCNGSKPGWTEVVDAMSLSTCVLFTSELAVG